MIDDDEEALARVRELFATGGPRGRDRAIRELAETLGYGRVGPIVSALERPGERLPLVIASVQMEQFRSSTAVWIGTGGEIEELVTLAGLTAKLQAWDGEYPEPSVWRKVEVKAATTARAAAASAKQSAAERAAAARARQVGAARMRLVVELGRFLVCLGNNVDDLNRKLHEVMTGASAGAQRARAAFGLLGEQYPDWDATLADELRNWLERQSPGARKARQAGAELDAALRDPRWAAQSSAA